MGGDEFVDSDSDTLPDFSGRKWFGGLGETVNNDPDSDELSNGNEVLAGTDQGNPDTDGDGCPDGIEFFAETDPLDANSFFKILVTSLSGTQVTLRWTTVPGQWYQTYLSDDLLSWTAVGPALHASGDFLQSTFTAGKSASFRFFRVGVSP